MCDENCNPVRIMIKFHQTFMYSSNGYTREMLKLYVECLTDVVSNKEEKD